MAGDFNISGEAGHLFLNVQPKVLFNQEVRFGNFVAPVKIEIDFSGVEPEWHEDLLKAACLIYAKDTVINGK